MRILWLKADFLHPTSRGGQIRTLEMLKRLHARHEVHYIGLDDGASAESIPRAKEYSSHVYPVAHRAPARTSPQFWTQLAGNLFSDLPLSLARYRNEEFRKTVDEVKRRVSPDAMVCDFLTPAVNVDDLSPWVLFQHNVETLIWRRHVDHAPDAARKFYFQSQAERMFRAEKNVCSSVKKVIAVSEADANLHREMFGVKDVPFVATGVDVESLTPAKASAIETDLVFVGSMDWMPNIDGMEYFLDEVLPIIRRKRPDCSVTVVGRKPPASLKRRAENDPKLKVTGTVPDVRPYLWSAAVSIVPLRVGGGTRLKIYEAMAARTPVVSTTIGAEGLGIDPPHDIRLEDSAEGFAQACLDLLGDTAERARMAQAAWDLVATKYSWEQVTQHFERILFQ